MLENLSYEELKELAKSLMSENEFLKKEVNRFTSTDLTLEEMEEQYKEYYSQV